MSNDNHELLDRQMSIERDVLKYGDARERADFEKMIEISGRAQADPDLALRLLEFEDACVLEEHLLEIDHRFDQVPGSTFEAAKNALVGETDTVRRFQALLEFLDRLQPNEGWSGFVEAIDWEQADLLTELLPDYLPAAFLSPNVVLEPIKGLIDEGNRVGISPPRFASLLRIDMSVFAKINERLLDPLTIPQRLIENIARTVKRQSDQILAYLSMPPASAPQAMFKASQAPAAPSQSTGERESFQVAVETSSLSDADKQYWLSPESLSE